MNIKEQLEQAITKRQSLINEINKLELQKQGLLAEALRMDGEIRILERLTKQENKEK